MLCAGRTQIWLANVVTNEIKTLINASSSPYLAQSGAIFLPSPSTEETKYKDAIVRLAYSSQLINSNDMMQYEIHVMTFFEDFKRILTKLGHIPEVSVDRVEKLELKIRALEN